MSTSSPFAVALILEGELSTLRFEGSEDPTTHQIVEVDYHRLDDETQAALRIQATPEGSEEVDTDLLGRLMIQESVDGWRGVTAPAAAVARLEGRALREGEDPQALIPVPFRKSIVPNLPQKVKVAVAKRLSGTTCGLEVVNLDREEEDTLERLMARKERARRASRADRAETEASERLGKD